MGDRTLSEELSLKEQRVREIIRRAAAGGGHARVLVGFSGGVDSSLLLWECVQALGPGRVVAVTATSYTSVPEEEEQARRFAADLTVAHLIIPTQECSDPDFVSNPPDRCYVCKRVRYAHLKSLARGLGPVVVLDGSQADDDPSNRPGMRALEELEIMSPLARAGIGKQEVRTLLRTAGFPDLAEKKAEPCLATRIPTGDPITEEALERVRRGESYLKTCGLGVIRLRDHGAYARIVTDRVGMDLLANNRNMRKNMVSELKKLGYRHVTLDLEEYGASG